MGPRKDQRVGYHVFAPAELGAFKKPFLLRRSLASTLRAPFRAVGCASNVCRLESVQPECTHVGKFPCFFSFSVVLINPQQSAESVIYPHIGPPSGGMCKDQATWILNPAKLPGFAEGRHIEVSTSDVNANSATSLTSPSKDRAIPFRFAVVLLEFTDAGVLVHFPCLGVRLHSDFTSSQCTLRKCPLLTCYEFRNRFSRTSLALVFRWNRGTVLKRLTSDS